MMRKVQVVRSQPSRWPRRHVPTLSTNIFSSWPPEKEILSSFLKWLFQNKLGITNNGLLALAWVNHIQKASFTLSRFFFISTVWFISTISFESTLMLMEFEFDSIRQIDYLSSLFSGANALALYPASSFFSSETPVSPFELAQLLLSD